MASPPPGSLLVIFLPCLLVVGEGATWAMGEGAHSTAVLKGKVDLLTHKEKDQHLVALSSVGASHPFPEAQLSGGASPGEPGFRNRDSPYQVWMMGNLRQQRYGASDPPMAPKATARLSLPHPLPLPLPSPSPSPFPSLEQPELGVAGQGPGSSLHLHGRRTYSHPQTSFSSDQHRSCQPGAHSLF